MRWLLLALAACGDNLAAPGDAGVAMPDATAICTAAFSGNFTDSSLAPHCASLAAGTLMLAIPVTTLAMSLPVQIDLGAAPSPGFYSSETIAAWSARVGVIMGVGACIYNAGATAVPPGDFQLTLSSVDDPHGSLQLAMPVLASPGTNCGDGDVETVTVTF